MDASLVNHRPRSRRQDLARRRRADVIRQYTGIDPVRRYRIARAHADMTRRTFEHAAMRIGRSGTVHAVRWRVAADGIEHPAPACHIGTDRPDSDPSIRPVYDQPVTCRLCLRRRVAHEEGQPYIPAATQGQLWSADDGVPPLAPFPPPPTGEDETPPHSSLGAA